MEIIRLSVGHLIYGTDCERGKNLARLNIYVVAVASKTICNFFFTTPLHCHAGNLYTYSTYNNLTAHGAYTFTQGRLFILKREVYKEEGEGEDEIRVRVSEVRAPMCSAYFSLCIAHAQVCTRLQG